MESAREIEPPAFVAASYPPLPAVPTVRARRIHWLFALFVAPLAILMPKRMGPHLAASGWLAALVVHFGGLALCACAFAATYAAPALSQSGSINLDGITSLDHFRAPLALAVLGMMVLSETTALLVNVGVGFTVFEIALWLAAVGLMALFTAGERRGRLFGRCAKLLLWGTGCAGLLLAVMMYVRLRISLAYFDGAMAATLCGIAIQLAALWSVVVLLRLGARYGGPPDGPGWEPRTVRCEKCGYDLTLSRVDGRCSECGEPVANSLPERRSLPDFARGRGIVGKVRGYFKTAWRVVVKRSFAKDHCALQGHGAARAFAYLTCALVGFISTLALTPLRAQSLSDSTATSDSLMYYITARKLGFVSEALPIWIWLGVAALLLVLVVGVFVTSFGFRDATRRSVLLCYSSAWLLLVVMLGILSGILYAIVGKLISPHCTVSVPGVSWPIDCVMIVAGVLAIPPFSALVLWWVQLAHLLRDTRYANA